MHRPFTIDGVCHPYNFAKENLNGRFGRIFNDVMHSFHPLVNPPGRAMSRQEWERDWQPQEFIETMLLESWTDMCAVHSTPIYDAYGDGLVSNEKGAWLKERYPDRVIWYTCADLFDDRGKVLRMLEENFARGADGVKLYPSRYVEGFTESWRMDSRETAFPVFELAQRHGVRNIAVHKALPIGPISSEGMLVDDISAAANCFPDLNFQIVHAGFMFVEETSMLLRNHPNIYATMEASMLFAILDPPHQVKLFSEFFAAGGFEKVIFASAAVNPHPQVVLDALAAFQMPEGSPFQLNEHTRGLIMGGNLARLHGIDIEARRKLLADDEFERQRAASGLLEPWTCARRSGAHG
jgi:uncharacterized protein